MHLRGPSRLPATQRATRSPRCPSIASSFLFKRIVKWRISLLRQRSGCSPSSPGASARRRTNTRSKTLTCKTMGSLDSKPLTALHVVLHLRSIYRRFTATLKTLIPLGDPNAPTNSPQHPNNYPEFPRGHTVLALYPDTSCFYRARVSEDREKASTKAVLPSLNH